MKSNPFYLLTQKRFLPLFLTQFLGAFNDNLFKNALVVLVTFCISSQLPISPQLFVTVIGCLLILPMFLFSAQAGFLADKYEKTKLIKIIKLVEILLMSMGAIGFITQSVVLLMLVLFLLGMHATFFGPLKYSILPFHLSNNELMAGNSLIESGTFLAILLGNILGAVLITQSAGVLIISSLIIICAVVGLFFSYLIPKANSINLKLDIPLNFIKATYEVVRYTRKNSDLFMCILGISWFWFVGFIFLTEFPNFTKDCIGGNESIFALFLTVFSIGIGIGSLLCQRLLKERIEATYVPLAALGMSLFTFDLYFSTRALTLVSNASLITLWQFFQVSQHWRILLDFLLISVSAGVFIVPLYAILQHKTKDSHKARVIASNNIMNSLFMTLAAIATMVLIKIKFTIPQIFFVVGLMNLLIAIKSCQLLPVTLIKAALRLILKSLYKVEIKGLEHFDRAGKRVVITPNHTSLLDGLLLAAFFPDKVSFAMQSSYAKKWWVKILSSLVDIFSLESTNPYVIKTMVKYVKSNQKLVVFPEGRITVTGNLMKIYEGPGLIADKADSVILPVLIEGAQYSPFSRLKGRVPTQRFPKITITVFPAEKHDYAPELSGRSRRQKIGEKLYQTMSNIMFLGSDLSKTLFGLLLDAKKIHGGQYHIIEDIKREPISYKKLILGSIMLGRKLSTYTAHGEAVGILLPNVNANPVTFFALQAYGRVAALLNFSTGVKNVVLGCQTAIIRVVCTSRAFVETAKLESMIEALEAIRVKIIYLEDLKAELSFYDKFRAMIISLFPKRFGFAQCSEQADNPAVILFTSGSEGAPKAVVLSSRNILANQRQLASRVDFNPSDIVLNALPMFHSFGLTVGTLLPILYGIKVFLYPSPLHYRIIPELSYNINATILFGTNTFLAGYAKYANPYDFYSIRYVYAGAEQLKDENRRLWSDKFGIRILEGYGTTEASPVVAANTPMHNRSGSVGKFLPNIEYQLCEVPGITCGGRLSIKGPNIMVGYMLHDNPGVIVPLHDGWYDTGDIVSIDNDGYVKIEGRAKRFAKVGGEMISLAYVENLLDELWKDETHAVVAMSDEKKGEQLILCTTYKQANKQDLIQYIRSQGSSELFAPKIIHILGSLPLLGSGKLDYPAIIELTKNLAC